MSDSWPTNVWTHLPVLISQTFAVASQAPDTKICFSGATERLHTHTQKKKRKQDKLEKENKTKKQKRKKKIPAVEKKGFLPHHITSVVRELESLHASLNVPEETGHISGAGKNLAVAEEAAAGEIAGVRAQLPGNPH